MAHRAGSFPISGFGDDADSSLNEQSTIIGQSRTFAFVIGIGAMMGHFNILVLLLVCSIITLNQLGQCRQSDDDHYVYKHHNNLELNVLLQKINTKCPSISRLYQLTERSVNGWPLTVIELSTNPGQHQLLVPEVKIVANMHGNEVLGREMLLRLADYICTEYLNNNKDIVQLLNR